MSLSERLASIESMLRKLASDDGGNHGEVLQAFQVSSTSLLEEIKLGQTHILSAIGNSLDVERERDQEEAKRLYSSIVNAVSEKFDIQPVVVNQQELAASIAAAVAKSNGCLMPRGTPPHSPRDGPLMISPRASGGKRSFSREREQEQEQTALDEPVLTA